MIQKTRDVQTGSQGSRVTAGVWVFEVVVVAKVTEIAEVAEAAWCLRLLRSQRLQGFIHVGHLESNDSSD